MNKFILSVGILLLVATILFSGCVSNTTDTNSNIQLTDKNVPVNSTNNSGNAKYNLSEISKHNTPDNCWMAIDGKVYDLTKFIALGKHNPVINQGCGIDASQLYNERLGKGPHSPQANDLLTTYYLGELN